MLKRSRYLAQIKINTNGLHGVHGSDGNGYKNAQDGVNGAHGMHGADAKDINITLNIDEQSKLVVLSAPDESKEPYFLPLGEAQTDIQLIANGGHGGNGGDGAPGRKGKNGINGQDATEFTIGTNGTDGQNGGHGGSGGAGGSGGHGGDITVTVDEKNLDLLMLVTPENHGGRGGVGGDGGLGGVGGRGGAGGNSYSWSEITSYTVDPEGNLQPMVTTRVNVGGVNGKDGLTGKKGATGNAGYDGSPGSYIIKVPKMGVYNERYDVQVINFTISSDDGVIEPKETLSIPDLTLANMTHMPAPEGILVSIGENKWVSSQLNNALTTKTKILPSSTLQFEEPLKFCIKSATRCIPAINSVFCQK